MSGRLRVSRDEIEYSDDSENEYDRGYVRGGRQPGGRRTERPGSSSNHRSDRSGSSRDRDSRQSRGSARGWVEEPDRGASHYRDYDGRGGSRSSEHSSRRSKDSAPPTEKWGERQRFDDEDEDEGRGRAPSSRSREPSDPHLRWEDAPPKRSSADQRESSRPEQSRAWNDASRPAAGGRSSGKGGFTAPRDPKSAIVVENVVESESDTDVVPPRGSKYIKERDELRPRASREPVEERPRASRESFDEGPKYGTSSRQSSWRADSMRASVNSDVGAPIRASKDYDKDRAYTAETEDSMYPPRSKDRDHDDSRERDGRRGRDRDEPRREQLVREDSQDVISLSDNSDIDDQRGRSAQREPVAKALPVAEAVGLRVDSYAATSSTSRTVKYGARDRNESDDFSDERHRRGVERQGLASYVMTAQESGGYTDLVQCLIVREKSSVLDGGGYNLFIEDSNKLLIYAQKKSLARTSNYHMFDMTRPVAGKTLSKKSGNFVGKLRALNLTGTDYVLVTAASEREEVAAISYDQISLMDQMKEGSQPRRINVMVPTLDADSLPVPNHVGKGVPSLIDCLKSSENGKMFVFHTKEPKFENGNYRLNFHGRVSVPSVKNFQLSSREEPDHIVCQFGKIGDDRFHLDFKAPLNAFQAFAIALTQFNI